MNMLTLSVLVLTVLAGADGAVTQRSSTSCPTGWTESNGRCFHYVPAKLNWAKAEKNCQTMSANLASVHSAGEYHDIQTMIAKITKAFGRTWLGAPTAKMRGYGCGVMVHPSTIDTVEALTTFSGGNTACK